MYSWSTDDKLVHKLELVRYLSSHWRRLDGRRRVETSELYVEVSHGNYHTFP